MNRFLMPLALFSLFLLAACADITHQSWMEKCKYIEESRVRVECGRALANIDAALRNRENSKFFGGSFERLPEDAGQCGRFVLHKSFTGGRDAIITLYPEPEGTTVVAVYQEVSGKWSRDLAFRVFDWAAGE